MPSPPLGPNIKMQPPVMVALLPYLLLSWWYLRVQNSIRREAIFNTIYKDTLAKSKRMRAGNFYRGNFSWDLHCENHFKTEAEFLSYYKVTRSEFEQLAEALKPHCASASVRHKTKKLSSRVRLSITLRMLAGASYADLKIIHCVGKTTIYKCFKRTIEALDLVLDKLSFPVTDVAKLEALASGFDRKGPDQGMARVLTGIVGALDGIAIKIMKPKIRDGIFNPLNYFNRKYFFSLNVQAIVDSEKRFLWISAIHEGSSHDSTAFGSTRLGLYLKDKGFPTDSKGVRFFIAGDEAYSTFDFIVCPWGGRNLAIFQDSFNYWQSHLRIHIECAFGELVQRWGILWRPLAFNLKQSIQIIQVLARLHNLCVNRRVMDEVNHRDRTWGKRICTGHRLPDIRWHSNSEIWVAGGGDLMEESESSASSVGANNRGWGGNRNAGKPSQLYRSEQTSKLRSMQIVRPANSDVRPVYSLPADYVFSAARASADVQAVAMQQTVVYDQIFN